MSISQSLYDWLGRKLNADEVAGVASSEAVINAQSAKWMELARFIGVTYVSAAIQACDFRFYDADGSRNADAEWLWNVSPNQNCSAAELRDSMVNSMFADGEALVLPWVAGSGTTIWNASDWTVEQNGSPVATDHFVSVSIGGKPTGRDWYAEQLYRFRLDNTAGKRFSRLQDEIDAAYTRLAQSASGSYLNGNVKRYKWKRAAPPTGDNEKYMAEQALMLKSVKDFAQTDGSAAVFPEYEGNELSNFDIGMQTSNAGTDFINIRKDMFETVANIMRMPVAMLYGNTNNFASVFQSFLTFSVDPVAGLIQDELTRKTFTRREWASGARAVVDTSRIKHEDLYDAADRVSKLVQDSVLSVNDVLADFGREKIPEEWADEHRVTKNTEPVGGGEKNG